MELESALRILIEEARENIAHFEENMLEVLDSEGMESKIEELGEAIETVESELLSDLI